MSEHTPAAPSQPPAHGWLSPPAAHPLDSQNAARHSRFVEIAKIALPVTAVGLIGSLIVYSAVHQSAPISLSIAELSQSGGKLRMKNPTLTYTDASDRAFFVNADAATQVPGDKDRWQLDSIRARMAPPEGRGYKLTSDTGLLDAANKLLDLAGSVLVVSDEGYTFRARSAHVDMEEGRVTSNEPVRAQGGVTTIDSDRFQMWDKGSRIRFEGRVRFVSEPAPRATAAPQGDSATAVTGDKTP